MNLFVSIIVPVYNVEKWLAKCIDSILAQTYRNFELILVNDGTLDRSGEICEEYKLKDNRVKVVHKTNGGLSSARNAGIKVANGEYLFFVDSDDLVMTTMCEDVIDKIEKYHPDIIMFGYELLMSNEKRLPVFKEGILIEPTNAVCKSIKPHTKNDFSFTWRFVFKANFIHNNDIKFDEDIKIGEDALFNMEAIFSCSSMYVLHKSLYIYNDSNTESLMRKKYKKDFHVELDKQYIKKIKIIEQYNISEKDFMNDLYHYYVYVLIQHSLRNLCNGNPKEMFKEIKKLLCLKMWTESFGYFSFKKLYDTADNFVFFIFLCLCKFRFLLGIYCFVRKFYAD